ncbi:MAG: hypothetical protein HKN95_06980 [Acidimicrobiia bacterium]|nr:hypothetical protein [Acidimicrobiia bacterium]
MRVHRVDAALRETEHAEVGIGGVAFGIVGVFLAVPLTGMVIAVQQAVSDDPESSVVNLLTDHPYEITGRLEALIAERVEGSDDESEEDDDLDGDGLPGRDIGETP